MQSVEEGTHHQQDLKVLSIERSPQEDDSKYSELQSQIEKIRKIKDDYEIQKKQIEEFHSSRSKNFEEKIHFKREKENSKQKIQNEANSHQENIEGRQEDKRKEHRFHVEEIERRLQDICKLSSDQDIGIEVYKDKERKQIIQEDDTQSLTCPDHTCQFSKPQRNRQYGLIRNKNLPPNQSSGPKTSFLNPEGFPNRIPHDSRSEFSPQKILIQNFIQELHEKISSKNTQIQAEQQKNFEYREYLSLCQQQNEKLTQMNTKLTNDCDIKDQQYAIMKDEFGLFLQGQHVRDHKNKQLCQRMKETGKKWDSQFEEMDEIYLRAMQKANLIS